MELTLDKEKQARTFKRLWAAIITLLSLIGLINYSIGAFWSFNFYYLFGLAAPLFFVFVLVSIITFSRRSTMNASRFVYLLISYGLIIFISSALFYSANYVTSDWPIFNDSLVNLGNHLTYFNNPFVLYTRLEGGLFGGLIYTGLSLILGRVITLCILFTLLGLTIIVIFWPFISKFFKSIARKIKVLKHRNKVIRDARKVPSAQTITLIKDKLEAPAETPTTVAFIVEKHESAPIKKAIFGDDATNEPISFQPVIVNISKSLEKEESIDGEALEEHVQQQNLALDESLEKEEATETWSPNELNESDTLIPSVEEEPNFDDQSVVERLLRQAEIEENAKAPELVVPTFSEEAKAPVFEKVTEEPKVVIDTKETVEMSIPKVEPVRRRPQVNTYENYEFPSLNLLNKSHLTDEIEINRRVADYKMDLINAAFQSFKVGAHAISYTIGPAITRFDIKMDDDKSVSTLNKIIPDLNIRLGGINGRFEPIIIGKSTSGYEVPNERVIPVTLRDCIEQLPNDEKNKYAIPFGKNIDGKVIIGRVDEFPHLLVAGTTGSGKSVFVHSILVTLIMRNKPDDLKLLIIDPKRIEMVKYTDIPHLLRPIIKEPKEARIALEKLVDEMERRYRLFEDLGANKLSEYNQIARQENKEVLPRIIAIIDEYADITEMEKEISIPVLRLAQKSRAAGINIIVATQRPSTEIITGTIKANLPARVALLTASSIDSTVILGQGGAEGLLGNGDMLVDWSQLSNQGFTRIQGPYVDNGEIRAITDYLKTNYEVDYAKEFLDLSERTDVNIIGGTPKDIKDDLYEEVKQYVLTQDTISINRIQTTFGIAFNSAKPIYDMLMAEGIIVPPDASNSSRGAKVIHPLPPTRDELRIDNNDY